MILDQDWTQIDMPQWNDGAGISSSIPDVMTPSWANLSRDHKLLICQAGQIGELHKGGLQLENSRRELAIGMAAIEIYQTLIDRQYEVRISLEFLSNLTRIPPKSNTLLRINQSRSEKQIAIGDMQSE